MNPYSRAIVDAFVAASDDVDWALTDGAAIRHFEYQTILWAAAVSAMRRLEEAFDEEIAAEVGMALARAAIAAC